MSTASPDEAVEVEASLGSSSNFVTSALPVADGPLLLPNEETNSDTLEKDQARLDAAFDVLVEQQATTDALVERPARTDESIRIIPLIRRLASRTSLFSLIMFFLKFHLTRSQLILF
jgi:hypothetical protein